MDVKGLISKLLVFKNSATFVLVAIVLFTTCHKISARQNDTVSKFIYLGPPTHTSVSSSGSGSTK